MGMFTVPWKIKIFPRLFCRDCFELNTYALIPLSTALLARSQVDTVLCGLEFLPFVDKMNSFCPRLDLCLSCAVRAGSVM